MWCQTLFEFRAHSIAILTVIESIVFAPDQPKWWFCEEWSSLCWCDQHGSQHIVKWDASAHLTTYACFALCGRWKTKKTAAHHKMHQFYLLGREKSVYRIRVSYSTIHRYSHCFQHLLRLTLPYINIKWHRVDSVDWATKRTRYSKQNRILFAVRHLIKWWNMKLCWIEHERDV